ncbi:hypothetical protein KVR01_012371 [Diaporthe batatas]|uniref:uncharacterized protein n=1 Tax=Diaporthe batatas TaxID=748121 RepID=UPI001D05891A|nr:uncharacterized protein KVR01_012371 [Diaporthe batatas]KAG8157709.1 hypothetical protein KVR01_012371 [Diaporthe batatas]
MDPFVSREWSAPATSSADIGWDRRPRRRAHASGHYRPPHGQRLQPASLADQAARVAAAHIEDIDPSHLHDLSPRALRVLLGHLDFNALSLSTWKTLRGLARAGHVDTKDELALHQFLCHIEMPTADLSVYTAPLQSHNFAFISHLRIAGSCLIKSEELLYLPQWAKNLGLLEFIEPSHVGEPFPRLSDRLFKAWSLHDTPFPQLKGIRLSTHSPLVTKQSLQYFTQFPALIMLDIMSEQRAWTHSKPLASALGWIYCDWVEAERWAHEEDDHDKGNMTPGIVNQTSHRDWVRLSLGIDRLYSDPRGGIGHGNVENAANNGFKIYNRLELPALQMLQHAYIMPEPPWSCALASLALGRDVHLIRQKHYSSKRIFFWRYWQDGVKHPLPSKPQSADSVAERRDRTDAAVIRSSKKRSAASISDVLSRFGGV